MRRRPRPNWAEQPATRTVNHIVVVRQDLVDQDPALKQQLTDLFARARGTNGASVPPIGVEPNRKAFETLARFAHEQGVTPTELSLDLLFPA